MTRTINEIPDDSDALFGAHVATGYYGGQFTALYALTSTGSLELHDGDGLLPIIREVRDAIQCAKDSGYYWDAEGMAYFYNWLVNEVKKEGGNKWE
jgi:hypothetical protein